MNDLERVKSELEFLRKQNRELRAMAQRAGSEEAYYKQRCYITINISN